MAMSDERVQITAADFNGQTWDSSPFRPGPPWLLEAVEARLLQPHTRGDTDYARWDVTTRKGVVDAGPGDWVVLCADGSLSVEPPHAT